MLKIIAKKKLVDGITSSDSSQWSLYSSLLPLLTAVNEVYTVVLQVEANGIEVEDIEQKLVVPREETQHVPRGEGDVKEEGELHLYPSFIAELPEWRTDIYLSKYKYSTYNIT